MRVHRRLPTPSSSSCLRLRLLRVIIAVICVGLRPVPEERLLLLLLLRPVHVSLLRMLWLLLPVSRSEG